MANEKINRRSFGIGSLGMALIVPLGSEKSSVGQDDELVRGPTEAEFERDYPAPSFQPKWAKPQINRLMAQDFVIYAHSDLEMVKKLHQREAQPVKRNAGLGPWRLGNGTGRFVSHGPQRHCQLPAGARCANGYFLRDHDGHAGGG